MDFPGGQWLRLHTSNAGGTSSIPGWGTKIPHAMRHSQKTERKKKKKDTCTPMFTAALFTTANIWNQLKCPTAD